jgi:hypothetical protein
LSFEKKVAYKRKRAVAKKNVSRKMVHMSNELSTAPVEKHPQLMSNPRKTLKIDAPKKHTIRILLSITDPGIQNPKTRKIPKKNSSQGSTIAVKLMKISGRIWYLKTASAKDAG